MMFHCFGGLGRFPISMPKDIIMLEQAVCVPICGVENVDGQGEPLLLWA